MRYRKLIALLLAVLMMFALAACGGSDQSAGEEVGEPQKEAETDDTNEAPSDTLVVFFSATGNTKAVAEKIADITEADLYEIVPAVPYTDEDIDYGDEARSSIEQKDPEARPEIGGEDIDLSNYSTIFIGYPIWYGDAPRIMYTFVESHDFNNKTVIPFCTSDSSGIGNSGTNLSQKSGSGDWQAGERFAAGASEDDIHSWIDSLGL